MEIEAIENDFNCKLLKVPKMFMLISGCWRFQFTKSQLLQKLYHRLYSLTCQGICLILLICMAIRIPNLVNRDARRFVENVGFMTTFSLVATKLVICRSSTVGDLVSRIIHEEKALYLKGNPKIISNYNYHIKLTNKVHVILLLAIYSVCIIGILPYFVIYLRNESQTELIINQGNITGEVSSEKILPIEMWMPFDQNNHYGKTIVIMFIFIFTQTTFNSVSQILYISLMIYVIAELKNLQIIARKFDLEVSGEAESLANLKRLIIRHQKVIKFVDDLNDAIRYVMLQEYLLNSLSIANLMYQIPNSLKTSILFTIFYIDFLIVLVIQLFFMSWHANEIQVQSLKLSDALYDSNWYQHSQKVNKTILLSMIRFQKQLVIWIGPFLPMNLSVAIASMKAAYSYVTMMSRFSE
ncbi:odorant receptor 49b-like isoform X2 [Anthonomus grandis grandis]|uniref:odorant receptor 49b-like isoform X1 n=1 Tax=Anthonomus grandis grandis TaxID=2921223 RepID=UPI0021663CD6|nr:odorant receptor 49b-like isoform X1 [Anthonomus grandis grandis]XP_050309442.1 odorant receptor 49b-like isoform X2 [Anthonomus grandis grandis]